jgi:hypothetical protein
LGAQKIRVVNRTVTKLDERNGIRLSASPGDGVAWVEGTDFRTGLIEVDIRGKDVMQQSFVGIAFHRKDDKNYEVVYLRPFNFRAEDPIRKQHAVQYMVSPDFEWPRLRKEFPEEFENPVDQSLVPTDWVRLRVAVDAFKLQIFVGTGKEPALEVRKLGQLESGQIGMWVGNNSDGDFANHGVAGVDELVQGLEEPFHVGEVQAGRRLVEDVDGVLRSLQRAQFSRNLDALRFSTRERRR